MQHAALSHRQIRDAERVDENDVGKRRERQHGAVHGAQRGLMNVDAVDLGRVGGSDRPCERELQYPLVEALPLDGRHQLRIAHPGNGAIRMEHDSRRHNRTRQTPASNLVNTGHVHKADAPQRILERAHGRYAHK